MGTRRCSPACATRVASRGVGVVVAVAVMGVVVMAMFVSPVVRRARDERKVPVIRIVHNTGGVDVNACAAG